MVYLRLLQRVSARCGSRLNTVAAKVESYSIVRKNRVPGFAGDRGVMKDLFNTRSLDLGKRHKLCQALKTDTCEAIKSLDYPITTCSA